MKDYNKFVCISAGKINFLIPSTQIVTSVYCSGDLLFQDGKFVFENNLLPVIDFYNDNNSNNYCGEVNNTETALVIKNTMLYDDLKSFALVTTKECSVLDIEYKEFSLFSDNFNKELKKIGFVACYFNNNSVYYLVDIEVFLKNFLV